MIRSNPHNDPACRLSPSQRTALYLLVRDGNIPKPGNGKVVMRNPAIITIQTMESLTRRGFAQQKTWCWIPTENGIQALSVVKAKPC